MRRLRYPLVLLVLVAPLFAARNGIPTLNQPLFPSSVRPGSTDFTLRVDGSGFVPGAVVNWNGTPLATKFVNGNRLRATVPSGNVASPGTATVTATNPKPGGGTSNGVFFTVTIPSRSLTFAPSSFTVGSLVASVAVGDFNNDGKMDLAVLNQGADYTCNDSEEIGYVSIMLGNGDGTFTDSGNPLELGCLALGAYGLDATVADFNGDGRQDLAVRFIHEGGQSVAIYLGNGNGTFNSQPSSVLGSWDAIQSPVITGDFNHDGKLDLAFIIQSELQFIILYPGNGDGTFGMPEILDENTNNSFLGIGWLVPGDFNNDGILDIVAPYIGGPIINLLGNGKGEFKPVNTEPVTTLVDPRFSVSGDFNGDGILDLAFADSGSTALTVLLGNGDGTFTEKDGQPDAGQTTTFIATADLNGDGKLDLVLVDSTNAVLIYFGNGDGTFQTPLETASGNGANQLAIADFNGDGRLDMVLVDGVDNTVSLLMQSPGATVSSSSMNFFKVAVGSASNFRQVALSNSGSAVLAISSISANGDFTETNNCGSTLPLGKSCYIDIVFRPAATGLRTGNITIMDSAADNPQIIQLRGTGK